jgi:hypothetical protein
MKNIVQILVFVSIIMIATQAGAQVAQRWPFWEFNTDGDTEGWTPTGNGQITGFDTRDGKLVVEIVAAAGDAFINSPTGPYDSTTVTGFLAKMRHSADPTGGAARQFFFFPRGAGHNWIPWDPPAKDPLDGVVFVDLVTDPPERWAGLINNIRFDFSNLAEAYTVELDWVRPEGLYISNETFSLWDWANDKIADWDLIGDAANFNFDEQVIVDSLNYSLALTGSGSAQGLTQSIKGAADMELGSRIVVMGAVNTPPGSWDDNSKLTVRVRESSANDDVVSEIDLTTSETDGWVDFTTGPFTSLEIPSAARSGASVEILVTSPAGTTVYVDSLFVNVLDPVRTTGWPVNCVKLVEGQTIVIDGVVTPEEYQGAEAIVINADTVGGVDPHSPLRIHDTLDLIPGQWGGTPVEDFSATYYVMWDDEALYVAVSCEDDTYQFVGPEAFAGDALQFTISQAPFTREVGELFIPTVAPAGPDGNPIAANAFPGPFIQTDLFAHAMTRAAGSVDTATQNWAAEVKIPWDALQADLGGAVPPQIGDTIGFTVLAIDYDLDRDGNPELQVFSSTHANDWPWAPWPFDSADEPTQEALTFVGQ